jgi:16S rRNA (adenine1518-N6/adenine1519-N6)-dimethyltransferase
MFISKKSLGQHFLTSRGAIIAIIDASDIHPDDIVLEIGPGKGVLTEALVKMARKVIAIEKDVRLIPLLQEKFKKEIALGKCEIIEKDILKFDPEVMAFYTHPYKLIANIPYYITGQILRMFFESPCQPESMTLLVQKEVAERIVAKHNKESLLSLSVKAYGIPKIIKKVPRGSFSPAPNVDSAIIYISNISREKFTERPSTSSHEHTFFSLIHAGFAHKRKQLFPNLSQVFDKSALASAFERIGIDPTSRAEDISLETWLELSKTLS